MKPFLEVSHLNAWHGAAQILFDVSLHVGRGEVVALLGRNGAGKSSTLKAIMGLMPRREGEVLRFGTAIVVSMGPRVGRPLEFKARSIHPLDSAG